MATVHFFELDDPYNQNPSSPVFVAVHSRRRRPAAGVLAVVRDGKRAIYANISQKDAASKMGVPVAKAMREQTGRLPVGALYTFDGYRVGEFDEGPSEYSYETRQAIPTSGRIRCDEMSQGYCRISKEMAHGGRVHYGAVVQTDDAKGWVAMPARGESEGTTHRTKMDAVKALLGATVARFA